MVGDVDLLFIGMMLERRNFWGLNLCNGYVDNRIRVLEFEVGDYVFLKVSPMKSIMRFGIKGKLSPHFMGPFEVLERVGTLAYKVVLPSNLI